MSRAQLSQKMRKLLTVALPMQRVWFFFIVAVNSDSDTYPNIFLEIILLQHSCQNVYDSILIAAQWIKGCGHFQGFRRGQRFWHTSHFVH